MKGFLVELLSITALNLFCSCEQNSSSAPDLSENVQYIYYDISPIFLTDIVAIDLIFVIPSETSSKKRKEFFLVESVLIVTFYEHNKNPPDCFTLLTL